MLAKNDKLKNLSGDDFHKGVKKYKKDIIGAFGCLTSLVASSVFAKRVIVPFIATPLADKTKAWMSRNDKPIQTHKDTKNTYDTEEKEIIKPTSEKKTTKLLANIQTK